MECGIMLPGEKGAVSLALTLAEQYGYGNLIAWLKAGWEGRKAVHSAGFVFWAQ